jgi:hypothetical protein
MRRQILSASPGAILLLALAAPAEAQAPPTAPPIEMGDAWQGFHAGVNLGGGLGGAAANNTSFMSNNKLESSGAVGGVQGGYTWRVAPSWTLGIEGDFDRSSLTGR